MKRSTRNVKDSKQPRDAFAAIGAQSSPNQTTELKELAPIARNPRVLNSGKHDPNATFAPAKAIRSLEALTPELDALREKYREFEKDFSPQLESFASKRKLTDFDWRIATPEDWVDFTSVLAGKGKWEPVQIPHYGEPIGPASTFYRTSFNVSEADIENKALFIRFKGVDYKAHVFVNGSLAGSHEGFFAAFEFEISGLVRTGENTLLVRVDNDNTCLGESQHHELPNYDGDKIYAATNQGYDEPMSGWHHCPPGMGIYQDVYIESRPKIHINDIFIRPLQSLDQAEIWIEANSTLFKPEPIKLQLSIYGQNFEAEIVKAQELGEGLEAGRGINFYKFKLPLESPRLWSPETPWLYQAQVSLIDADGKAIDSRTQQFGMRWFTIDEGCEPKGMPYLNGQKICLRGANTMGNEQQCVMRGDFDQLREDLLLAKAANMNFLRLTQRPVQKEVYEACDRLGLMTQTDLPLFGHLRRNQFSEAVRQAVEMERHVRSHACNILVSYINEPFPEEWRNLNHRRLARPDLESFFKAASEAVHVENPDRSIKPVDGDYDPPTWGLPDNHSYTYWYHGHGIDAGKLHKGFWREIKPGWNYGCGEFGAEGIDRLELLEKYCPKDWLPDGPDDSKWSPERISKAQAWKMGPLFFDPPKTASEWIDFTREHQAHAMQRMTEAFRRDPRNVSCAIHLFIDAWPTGWMKTIVDVDRVPKPAYYAYREALTPITLNLRTDRERYWAGENAEIELWLCNDTNRTNESIPTHWQLEEIDGTVLHSESFEATLLDCEPTHLGNIKLVLPERPERTRYRLRTALAGREGMHGESTIELEAFPQVTSTQPILSIGSEAENISNQMGVSNDPSAETILCSDFNYYQEHEQELLKAVESGKTIILQNAPIGEHNIAGELLSVKEASMYPRFFVSARTDHKLVEGFKAQDFYWWFNAEQDRATPLARSVLLGDAWNTVLSTTDQGWATSETPNVAVCSERTYGEGTIIVSQIDLDGFISHNPTARLFVDRLVRTSVPAVVESY